MRASSIRKSLLTAAAGVFAIAAVPAQAQLSTTANGPYYATPSWDQKLTTNRFVILFNWNSEAVLDRETGLVWQRTPVPDRTILNPAKIKCMQAATGGRYGWRLATYHELSSLQDSTKTLPLGHPFVVDVDEYQTWWSATKAPPPEGSDADWAFVRNLRTDTVVSANGELNLASSWCVRGGQGVNSN